MTLPSIGRRRRQSTAMPRQVLMSEMASAPPASAALAIVGNARHVRRQLGDDRRGTLPRGNRRRVARTLPESVPKSTPPETFGQEMFSSIAAMPASPSSRAAISTNSSCVRPAMLTMIGTPSDAEVRQVMRDEGFDAVVVEADRVEHAGGGFDRPPGSVAGARLLRDRFGQDAAEAAEVDQAFHLAGVAERARGDEDRIRQPQPAEL